MTRICILTGSELRHTFVRKAIALDPHIDVVRTFCEGTEKSLINQWGPQLGEDTLQMRHLRARELSEKDFFEVFVILSEDASNPVSIPKGAINEPERCAEIEELNPDLIVAYGPSFIKGRLLEAFKRRFLNAHLGLSPYYRGSGTNFWALVNGEPECVGTTFMYMDEGVDTGEIVHQIRARIFPGDGPHQIGNRLIADTALTYMAIVRKFNDLSPVKVLPVPPDAKYYRRKDFSAESVETLYANFRDGMVDEYLSHAQERADRRPIRVNPALGGASK